MNKRPLKRTSSKTPLPSESMPNRPPKTRRTQIYESIINQRAQEALTSDQQNDRDKFFEKLEEAGLDQEEVLEVNYRQPEHLWKWLLAEETFREGSATPVQVVAESGAEEVGSNSRFKSLSSVSSNAAPRIVNTASSPAAKEEPNTSGTARQTRCEYNGSEYDSDYDEDWDMAFVPEPLISCEILDEDLDDPLRTSIAKLEKDMDEAYDGLLGMNVVFNWESSYDTFRGVKETFTGPTPGPVSDYETPYDAFVDIWDESIMGRISVETNRYAEQTIESMTEDGVLGRSSRLRKWAETSVDEMYVLFGVLIIMGNDPRGRLKEYWSNNKYIEMPGFKKVMSYSRYILLNKFLHFVDNSTLQPPAPRSGIPQSGEEGLDLRLQKLQPLIDKLSEKFRSLYHLLPDISIDESLLLFKGRVSWLQAIRTKSARFGMKSFELCEAKTGYLHTFNIYTGRTLKVPTVGAEDQANNLGGKTTKVVQNLMDGLWNRGHCLTMDNFFNSPALARYLKLRGTDCLGTLRPNRVHVPDAVKMPSNAPRGTLLSRHSGDISITSWNDVKPVTLISTFHDDSTFMGLRGGRPCIKPKIVKDYNSRMGGVEVKDQKLSYYLIERKRGLKWYIKMFKRLFNTSVHNAWVMFNSSRKRRGLPSIAQRDFRYDLADALIVKHHADYQPRPSPATHETRLNRSILHIPQLNQGKDRSRGRCVFCYRHGIRKVVPTKCKTCEVFLCFEPCWEPYHSLETLPERPK